MRGQQDYGAMAAKEVSASVSDMGEVAARLGSIVTYDKRGDVVDFDNFEEPVLKWNASTPHAGCAIYLDSAIAKSGSQSVKLVTPDIASAPTALGKYFPLVGSKQLGLEVSWCQLTEQTDLRIWLQYFTGAKLLTAAVRLDLTAGKIYLFTPSGVWKDIEVHLAPLDIGFAFSTLKLVADFNAKYYKRLLLANAEKDLSSEAMWEQANSATAGTATTFQLINQDALGGYVWIDDVIWTQAEP